MPAVFTGALAMVAAPAITKREADPAAMRRLLKRTLWPGLLVSIIAMIAIWLCAPFFANRLYRQAELEPLLRMLCPSVVLMGMQQVVSGLMAGLGQQRRALYASLTGSLISVGLNYVLAGMPQLRLTGVAIATQVGLTVTLLMNARYLALAVTRVSHRIEDGFAAV